MKTKNILFEQREQLQEDLRCILDGLDEEVVDRACQAVVNRYPVSGERLLFIRDEAKEKEDGKKG